MDSTQRHYYGALFELEFLKRTGTEYERLFTDIMSKIHPEDFFPVVPWGSDGDRKNDGYLKSEETLYASYAPREMDKYRAVSKIKEDYNGAKEEWGDKFTKWVFVHNCKDGYIPAHVLDILTDLDEENDGITVTHFGYHDMRNKFFELTEHQIMDILGLNSPAPSDTTEVRFDKIQKVLNTISGREPDPSVDPKEVDPGKLEANHLSDDVASLLSTGRRKSYQVKKFFDNYHDPSYGDGIAQTVNDKYRDLRETNHTPDEIFFELQSFIGGNRRQDPEYEMSLLATLSYFFEQCEIFEPARS